MKKCPFCAENIQDEAIECRYCGGFLEKTTKTRPDYIARIEELEWFYRDSRDPVGMYGPLRFKELQEAYANGTLNEDTLLGVGSVWSTYLLKDTAIWPYVKGDKSLDQMTLSEAQDLLHMASASSERSRSRTGGFILDDEPSKTGPTNGLRAIAWIDLIVSIISALVLWATCTSTVTDRTFLDITHSVTNFFQVGLGFGILFQGIFVCVFFLVAASMADNIGAIRRNTKVSERATINEQGKATAE